MHSRYYGNTNETVQMKVFIIYGFIIKISSSGTRNSSGTIHVPYYIVNIHLLVSIVNVILKGI